MLRAIRSLFAEVYQREPQVTPSGDMTRQAGQREFDKYMDELLRRAEKEDTTDRRKRQFVYTESKNLILRQPGTDKYPLWRVECTVDILPFFFFLLLSRTHCNTYIS